MSQKVADANDLPLEIKELSDFRANSMPVVRAVTSIWPSSRTDSPRSRISEAGW